MKQRLTYALVSSAACIALTAWLVPYAPTPKAEGIGQIEVLGTIQGGYHQYVTRWLNTTTARNSSLYGRIAFRPSRYSAARSP